MGCRKNLVDRAIAAAGDDAINFSSTSFSNGFGGQSCSVAGFPSDPHFHNLIVLAQCANGRSQSTIAGCLAVQNNADGCHTFRPWCSRALQVQLGLDFAARCASIFYHTPRSTATAILSSNWRGRSKRLSLSMEAAAAQAVGGSVCGPDAAPAAGTGRGGAATGRTAVAGASAARPQDLKRRARGDVAFSAGVRAAPFLKPPALPEDTYLWFSRQISELRRISRFLCFPRCL